MLRSVLLGLTTFFLIFGWKAGEFVDLIFLVSLSLIVASLIKGQLFADRAVLKVITCLGLLSIYSMLVVLLNGLFDTQIAMRSLRALVNFLGALALTNFYFAQAGSDFANRLIRDIYLALSGHAALMTAMFMSTSLRNNVYQITDALAYVNLGTSFLDGYRISGLTYGLSQTSVLQMLGLLLMPMALRSCQSCIGRLLIIAGAPLLAISVLISGRSGLLLGMAMLPLSFPFLLIADRQVYSPTRAIAGVLKFFLLVFGIAFLTRISISWLPERFTTYTVNQAMEVYSALTLSGPTVEATSDMFFLPGNWRELIFGSSNLGRGSLENIPSDVGWVKTIFAIGIIGTLMMLMPYLLAIMTAYEARHIDPYLSVASVMVFVSALLLNTKELALLTRNQWSVHALLFSMLCLMMRQRGGPAENAA